ncbi:MAG: DEAD/DEAH box helicase [Candidatus Thermoplasmatota archaeon]
MRDLAAAQTLSISAPTSAGKSFVLRIDLAKKLLAAPRFGVYIVPTRALIHEIQRKLADLLASCGLGDVPVLSTTIPRTPTEAPKGCIYVLTQERLLALLDAPELWLTTLIVDEAQELGKGSRGIVLETAVEDTLRRFPNLDLYFAAPLLTNPEYFPTYFRRPEGDTARKGLEPPISQNVILVDQARIGKKNVSFRLQGIGENYDLGDREVIGWDTKSKPAKRAALAAAVAGKEMAATIIFSDSPKVTVENANALKSRLPRVEDAGIEELVDFLLSHVHAEYPLASLIRHRVAYHHGRMPTLVRNRVEDLFRSGAIRFLCCTSTLLYGVNLPAKHIVIDQPHLSRGEFLNLAGRAGRLDSEFQGNVWCLNAGKWDELTLGGEETTEVRSSYESTLRDGGTLVVRAIEGAFTRKEADDAARATTALAKIVVENTRGGTPLIDTRWLTDANRAQLAITQQRCEQLQLSLPNDIYRRNITFNPVKIDALHAALLQKEPIEDWIPNIPRVHGPGTGRTAQDEEFWARLQRIYGLITESLYGRPASPALNTLTAQWMRSYPLRMILDGHVRHRRKRRVEELESQAEPGAPIPPEEPALVGTWLEDMFTVIEQDLRFERVRGFRAYADVLRLVMHETGRESLIGSIAPWDLYLEFGSADRLVIDLSSLGISRLTALELRDVDALSRYANVHDLLARLRELDLVGLGLSRECAAEVERVVGRRDNA